ncbi:MAG: VOC family protein, partial [Chromatiaceae bacterium]
MSLTLEDEADARRKFEALAAEGEVRMPMTKTFWSPCFGMLTDRFGLSWMIQLPGSGDPV